MSFWTILSCCFSAKTTRDDTIRPRGLIELNGTKVSALFDTGSAITLVDAKYMDLIVSGQKRGPSIRLCGANATPLINKGTYEMAIKVNNRVIMQAVHFIENLQVPCILGMKRARITIDVSRKCIKMGKQLVNREKVCLLYTSDAADE